MNPARCWFGRCTDRPAFCLVPANPALHRTEACRVHLGDLIASTLERHSLDTLAVERILPGSLTEAPGEKARPPGSRSRRSRRGRFTGMQEVSYPHCGHRLLVAMYRHRLDSPQAIARAREIALSLPCPTCRQP